MRQVAIRDGKYYIVKRDDEYYVGMPVNVTFTITFKSYDGTVISTEEVSYGEMPTIPTPPTRTDGYVFTGWDTDVKKVTADKTYTAVYIYLEETTIDLTDGTYALEIPEGVKVIRVDTYASGYSGGRVTYTGESSVAYNGVTWESASSTGTQLNNYEYVGVTGGKTYDITVTLTAPGSATASATVTWSGEINKQTPTIEAYI